MENKDNIKEVFKNRFDSYEAHVDPKIWSGIESQVGIGTTTSWVAGVSNTVLSAVALVSVIAAVTGIVYFKDTEVEGSVNVTESHPKVETESVQTDIEITDNQVSITENEAKAQTTANSGDSNLKPVSNKILNKEAKNEIANKSVDKVIINKDIITENKEQNLTSTIQANNGATDVISKAPEQIVVEDQSKALASPSGGVAPLKVEFSATSEIAEVNWKFDDGTESSDLNPEHEFVEPGIYFVTMLAKLKDGSVIMDKAVIEVKAPVSDNQVVIDESSVFVPNVFTPNGDGENDELIVVTKGIHTYSISIYSVNGKLVYKNENPEVNWNGNDLNGMRVEDGTYYYLINALGEDQKVYTPKGYLTIRGGN